MVVEALADGSKRFVLRKGPADGIVVRLFPHNGGWSEVIVQGHLYVAPKKQDAKKPFMTSAVALGA